MSERGDFIQRIQQELRMLPAAVLVILFGLFLHQNRLVALVLLALALAQILHWSWRATDKEFRTVFAFRKCHWIWLAGGAISAIALAILLRWRTGFFLYPRYLTAFLVVAMLIGSTEEIVFRGYFLGRLIPSIGNFPANAVATFLHTAYKVVLFVPGEPDRLLILALPTFLVGLLIGWMRTGSRSIWPCVFAHAIFDFWVYADRQIPWWVW